MDATGLDKANLKPSWEDGKPDIRDTEDEHGESDLEEFLNENPKNNNFIQPT